MKKRGSRQGNYSRCWDFINECRWYHVFALGIFCFFFLIGFTFPIFFRAEIFNYLSNIVLELEGRGIFGTIVFIILNNLRASFFAVILGILFGIFPLATSVVNGYLVGFVSRGTAETSGIWTLWRLFPHGIFEIPAVILSMGMGLKLGLDLFGKNKKQRLSHDLKEALRFFVFVILPLLLIAGIIEGVLVSLFS